MVLSSLQQFIVRELFQTERRLKKDVFLRFYLGTKIDHEIALKDIGRSIERLVERDLVKATGVKTAKKWYTKTVSLTPRGRSFVKKNLGNQLSLPLTKKRYA